ncbi:3-deoxy-D-manno-octulosonic acid transferase [Chryseobacterium taklimakanense]|uniref:3-deoxy-D-manno-octulosonic acid transferase n=1 Tax=Chryseobacterium taklimakanense TaxID=536441 RepID=A0A3G8WJM0_9FLAO|nr:glycosyltransferase N-terminal domain-containing protein [Chryseobacterium taklimakanense]AZI19627.1 3-deoxy-D-manno-octulosonic acid transferase [Chryseobacterium taklimakanense]
MQFLYNIFISLMVFGFKVGAAFNYKLKRGLAGRRQSCETVKSKFSKTDKVIWMHAASLGEYEQGLPVLERLKENLPAHKILITFFSPSGYEVVVKKNHIADAVCYLPFDLKKWVSEFTNHFHPDIFFTVKYDYWYNLLNELRRKGVKTYVVSALFYERQVFFRTYGEWFVTSLKKNIDWFFHQTKSSYALAKTIHLDNSSIAGDTRFDRVKQIKDRWKPVEGIDEFKGNKKLLVFGSSWEAEEAVARIVLKGNKDIKLILAPHDLIRVGNLKEMFPNAVLYSKIINRIPGNPNINLIDPAVLIVDSIGLLARLYSYADLAVVGGGFHSAGLHNILEAATYGVPVIFGNHYRKNPEADALIDAGGGKSFADEHYAANFILKILQDDAALHKMKKNAGYFIQSQPNATEIILNKILGQYLN